jgi:hypothetical protein
MNAKKHVILSEEVVVKAEARARALGLTLSEYMQALVDKDVRTKEHDPWRQPVPTEVAERWSRELAEFEQEHTTNPRPAATSGEALIKLLDEEAATLPDDEGD